MRNFVFSLVASTMTAAFLLATPQAVVFDWGNVIGFNDRSLVINFMCHSFHCSEAEFEIANLEKRKAVASGQSDVHFWLEFATRKGISLPQDWERQYILTLKESVGADPHIYVLIEQLQENDIRVGLLSNIDDRYTKLIRDFGFYAPFDPCLLSCEMGIEKPDPRAYELLLHTIDLPAQDVVFIDDKLENVEAARAMGMDAILFKSEAQLRNELLQRGALE